MDKVINKVLQILYFIVFIWTVFLLNFYFNLGWNQYGIVPRTVDGMYGIITAPFLHGNFPHIISNSIPLAVLLLLLYLFYEKLIVKVPLLIIFIGGISVWLFGRTSSHIGASGLIYGLAAFLAAFGLYQQKLWSIALSLGVIFMYGGLIYGVLPTQSYVSWESHLFGALSGLYLARRFKKTRL